MNKMSIEINFKCESFGSALEVWSYIDDWYKTLGHVSVKNDLTGTWLKSGDISSSLKRTTTNRFSYSVGDGAIFYNNSGSANGQIGKLLVHDLIGDTLEAELLLKHFFSDSRYTSARVFHRDYEFLQNETDIDYFIRKGLDYKHLPIKNNGLPFPLEKEIIDISTNPGMRLFNFEFIEVVGSTMWLSERFWEVTGTSKRKVLSSNLFDITELNNIVKIIAQDKPFSDWKGEEGERQNQLRSLLFGV